MATAGTSRIQPQNLPSLPALSGTATFIAAFFFIWLAIVLVLGANGAFLGTPGSPPLGLLIGLVAPLTVFLVGYRAIEPVRAFILSADIRIIAGVQAWRWAGFGFLSLYAYKILPGIFAWPAGLGDMAVGITAPLVLASLIRRPDFAASKRFVAWNLSGILDLAVAVTIGAIGPLFAPSFYSAVPTDPMLRLPLVLIPTYLVPMFLMLHLTALLQARQLRHRAIR